MQCRLESSTSAENDRVVPASVPVRPKLFQGDEYVGTAEDREGRMVKIRELSTFTIFLLIIFSHSFLQAQSRGATFYKPDSTYSGKPDTVLTMDFSHIQKPTSIESFNPLPHLPPVRQDTTGTCWAFAAASFLESELIRLGKGEIKLSEMFIVYHEYIEKARRFVRQLGDSEFLQGSQADAAIQRIQQYGIVRRSDYSGLLPGHTTHTHKKMKKEMDAYLNFIEFYGSEMSSVIIKIIAARSNYCASYHE